MNKNYKWTGERLETHVNNETAIEHLHRYNIALQYVTNKIVLDIASGEGYGSNLLSNSAEKVYGVDISITAIQNAKEKYKKPNLNFIVGKADEIPLPDNSVDVVVSFETIEHHNKHVEMLVEIKRVLKHNGILIISSPDKLQYSDKPKYKNPFHQKELYKEEFESLIAGYFKELKCYDQRFLTGSLIKSGDNSGDISFFNGNYNELKNVEFEPMYNIIIACDYELEQLGSSMFFSTDYVIQKQQEIIKIYTDSTTWKVGRFFINPIAFIKKLIFGS